MKKPAVHAWFEFAQMSADMLLASAEVIPKRLTRIANAKTPVSPRDRREFTRMSQEKLDAGAAVLTEAAMAITTAGPRWAMRTAMHLQAISTASLALPGSRSSAQLLARQHKLKRAVESSAKSAAAGSKEMASASKRSLKPVHKRAVANAKRLRKT